jgi:hypothetical protein
LAPCRIDHDRGIIGSRATTTTTEEAAMTYRQLIQFLMTLEPKRLDDPVTVSVQNSDGEFHHRVVQPHFVSNEAGDAWFANGLEEVVPDGTMALGIKID